MNTRTSSNTPSKAEVPSRDAPSTSTNLLDKAEETAAGIKGAAQEVVGEVTRSASSLASEANQKVKDILNEQVTVGADLVGNVAESVRAAAEKLDQNAPAVADVVRTAADRIEEFSQGLRGRSIQELVEITSGYARRKPLVLFGAAAAFGFLMFRVAKSTPPSGRMQTHTGSKSSGTGVASPGQPDLWPETSPSISPQPSQFHGA
jgi:hypothetical protein